MSTPNLIRRGLAAVTVVSLALAGSAPAARAGHDEGHGYKVRGMGRGPWMHERVVQPHRTVFVRGGSSDVAPVLAGLIGGFVLGTAVSHAAPPVVVHTTYWDPYCEDRYASLDRYEWHLRHVHHPHLVRVIDGRTGECVGTEVWRDGGWRDADAYDRHVGERDEDDR